MTATKHLAMDELENGLEHIRQSPSDKGVLGMIVRRPEGRQTGKCWTKGCWTSPKAWWATTGACGQNPPRRMTQPTAYNQITLMNVRVVSLVAQAKERWPLAGDQLYVDLDLSVNNSPVGTWLAIGTAVIEVSPLPHTGCKQFMARFGLDALEFVNNKTGKPLRLRWPECEGGAAGRGPQRGCGEEDLQDEIYGSHALRRKDRACHHRLQARRDAARIHPGSHPIPGHHQRGGRVGHRHAQDLPHALHHAYRLSTQRPDLLEKPLELLSVSGLIADGEPHLHIVVSCGENEVYGGHLHEGSQVLYLAEIAFLVFNQHKMERQPDPERRIKAG